jgi:PAS domain S-box-containing protein
VARETSAVSGMRQRLAAYGLLGGAHDADLDAIAADAARLTGAPAALIGFFDGEIEHIKACRGWQVEALPGAYSLAAPVMESGSTRLSSDASTDPSLARHPLVTGPPFLRFIGSAPIIDDGTTIGAVTVVDRNPHSAPPMTAEILRLLAARVTDVLAVRGNGAALRARVAQLEASLEESDDRFRDFFERTTDLIASIDAEGRLLHANEAFVDALAMSRQDLLHQPLARVLEPEAREAFALAFREVVASAHSQTIETVLVSSTGRGITVEGSFQPKVIDGRVALARVIFHDISERKDFEAELGHARDAALEAARLKTQFLTNVSHEIRTPMNGIIGMIDLLAASSLNEEQRDFARQARASAEHLLSVVNNILYVSNVQAGGLAAAKVDFDLYRLTQRIVEVMKVAILGKEVEIAFDWDDKLPTLLRGNQGKLRQIITNLMENAVKFTEQGTITLRVLLQTETDSHVVVRFEVKDTGIGISEEDRLLLFEKFSQIDAAQTRRFQGVGLGLSTARHLVETMGGLIDVESNPGVGSTFWFTVTFPKLTGDRQPIASSDLSLRGQRVLLVDQYTTNRRIVRHYLEKTWEMRVDTGQNGSEAMATLRAAAAAGDPYRVVVYDRMPDVDELAFARAVRGDAIMAGTGLVFLAGGNKALNEELMREAGIQSYVLKPVGQAELFDAIAIAVARDALGHARSALTQTNRLDTRLPLPVPPEKRDSVRILLVEDNFLNRKVTMSQLQKLGYHADTAGNGREALEALAMTDYEIIVMDCQMPIMDGYEATMQIRKRDGTRHRHIIAMTANALEGDREKCLAAGMDDYLSKPTRQDELEMALARCFVQ